MPRSKTPGPSVKDPEVYEALREDGASKEKAARIANASAKQGRAAVGRRGGQSQEYESWTVADLRRRAGSLGLTGFSHLRKSDLIRAIRKH